MSALYKVMVALHVVSVLGGLVAVGVTGGYCAAYWHNPGSPSARQFFAPGPGLGPRLLYPAAALGLLAAAASQGSVHLGSLWVWGAAVLWVAAVSVLEGWLRPAERRLQAAVDQSVVDQTAEGTAAGGPRTDEPGRSGAASARVGLACATAIVACIVVASLFMTVKPR